MCQDSDLAAIYTISRHELQLILEDQLGTAVYDDEPLSDLQECLREHIMDGNDPKICFPE